MLDILYDKKIDCLYCESAFTTKKVRQSKLVVSRKDSDFCYHYEGENPYFYEVYICPNCGCAFTQNFSPIKPAKKEILKKEYINKIEVQNLCGHRGAEDALTSYKLGLLCANFLDEPKINIAGILMRIAWLYRYRGNKEEEEKYLAKALSLFEHVYINEDLDKVQMGRQRLLYLIGELNGRLGNYEETRKWFNILFSERNIDPALNKLARDQWNEYKIILINK